MARPENRASDVADASRVVDEGCRMTKFCVTMEDDTGCDTSEHAGASLEATVLASMRTALVAIEQISDGTGYHFVLVQIEDEDTGRTTVVEVMVSVVVSHDGQSRH